MKTLWCKNQENPSDRISHAWAPLRNFRMCPRICRFGTFGLKKKLFACPPLMTTLDIGRSAPHNFYIGTSKHAVLM
jgi:hypothetical protein